VKLGRATFQPSTSRGTFLNWGLNEGEVGNSTENWPYLRNDEIWLLLIEIRLLLITHRKCHALSDKMEIIDLG